MKAYLGLDMGSYNTKIVMIDNNENIIYRDSIRSSKPIDDVKKIFRNIRSNIKIDKYEICNIGITGDNRFIIGKLLESDNVYNEIECIKYYAKNSKFDGKILEIGFSNNKIFNIKKCNIIDYKIDNSSNSINGKFLELVNSKLKVDINNIDISLGNINFKNDNLVLLYEEILDMINNNYDKNNIMASLIKKIIENGKYNLLISGFNNKSLFDYMGVNDNNYYIYAINSAYMAKNSDNDRYYNLNIDNYYVNREIKKCNKCSMGCEIVNIYRNHELIDSFGNSCKKWEYNKFNKKIYS